MDSIDAIGLFFFVWCAIVYSVFLWQAFRWFKRVQFKFSAKNSAFQNLLAGIIAVFIVLGTYFPVVFGILYFLDKFVPGERCDGFCADTAKVFGAGILLFGLNIAANIFPKIKEKLFGRDTGKA